MHLGSVRLSLAFLIHLRLDPDSNLIRRDH
jgi:hypothetical protein